MKPPYTLPYGGRNMAIGLFVNGILAALSVVAVAVWVATQYAAYRFQYHPALGEPFASIPGLGPIYYPFDVFWWIGRFWDVKGAEQIWKTSLWIIAVPCHLAVFATVTVVIRRAKRLSGKSDLFGSASWAVKDDLFAAELLGTDAGVYVGAWREKKTVHYLRHDGPENVLAVAPSRSGKDVGLVTPTCLSWEHSKLVHDMKGQSWALTAGFAKEVLGHHVIKFDPTSGDGSSAKHNPLLEVRPWPDDVKDAQNIADMLVDPTGAAQLDHWDITAHDFLVGVILHTLYAERDKSLRGCQNLIADPTRDLQATLNAMLTTAHDPSGMYGWCDATGKLTKVHPVVAGATRALMSKSENEGSSVVSSAIKTLSLYRDPIIADNTASCDFAITDLMHADKPVSLYLCTPPSDMSRTRPLIRLMLNQIGRRLTEKMEFSGGVEAPHYKHKLLLIMNEFDALGRLDFFQTGLAYFPGYGMKAYLLVQDMSQLHGAYGRDESIVSNCHVRVAYAPNKIETGKWLSDMAGVMTVHRETRTYTGSRFAPLLGHVMASEQESQRPLLTPDECLRLPSDAALIFVAGEKPIYGQKIRYYQDAVFSERAAIPPPAVSDRISHDWSHWLDRTPLSQPTTVTLKKDETETPEPPHLQGESLL